MKEEKRVCRYCGKDISEKFSLAKYCSSNCSARFWTQKNPEKRRSINKKYSDGHPETIKLKGQRLYIKNKEKYLKQSSEWKKAHPERNKIWSTKYNNRARAELNDYYVKVLLQQASFVGIEVTPEIINVKREIMLLKRQRKL